MQIFADEVIHSEAKPGWVFRPVGRRLLVAVTPWPEYGQFGTPAWGVKVVRVFDGREPTRRYSLGWSTRMRRWAAGGESVKRMQRDLTPGELFELDAFMRDTLEGALC